MILLAKIGVGFLGTAMLAGAAVSSEGFIHVAVHEKREGGKNFTVVVPAALVPATLHFVPREHVREASENLRQYMPVVDAAIPALEECPDGVLVEVSEPAEHVLIQKSGSSIVIDVNDHDEIVHVSVPLRAAQASLHQIAKVNGPM